MLYACAPFFYFTHSLGVSDSLNLHIQVYICYFADQVFEDDHTPYEELEFSYLIALSQHFLDFLIPIAFMILCIRLSAYSIHLFICYHV